jgi:methyltransferase (TIGR00027 family)
MKNDEPSATARLIARSLLLLSQDPAGSSLAPPRSAETSAWFLVACGENPARFQRLARQFWFRRLLFQAEHFTAPGILLHYALRKRRVEETIRQGLAAGAQQVVVLGAGFDTLAWRLHQEFPQTEFWEFDHPATQAAKQAALAAHRPPAANLHFCALNLAAQRLREALVSEPGYQMQSETVFVAEGLLMYLEPEQVANTFRDAQAASGLGSRFAFTFLEPQADGRTGFAGRNRFVDWWLRRRGEPFRWGVSHQEVRSFLNSSGWHLQEIIAPSDLRRRYLMEEPPRSATGDFIALAEWKA